MLRKCKKTLSVILSLLMLLPLFGCLSFTASAAYSAGDTIQFGSYPQTQVTDETLLAALEAADKNWVSYRYYSGTGGDSSGGTGGSSSGGSSGGSATLDPSDSAFNGDMAPGDWMKFADFFYGGNKYRAVQIDEYRPHAVQYALSRPTSSSSGTYHQTRYGYYLGTYYFLYEPLTWRVLDADEGLVICENIVDCQPFQNIVYMIARRDFRQGKTAPGIEHYAADYSTSTVRAWLNADFYKTAFTDAQRANVKESDLLNLCSYNDMYDAAPTKDLVFLLSDTEIANTAYGFQDHSDRAATGTDYAHSQNLDYDSYWLRSPSPQHDSLSAYVIAASGGLQSNSWVSDDYYGIRPACRLKELKNDAEISDQLYSGLHSITLAPGTLGGENAVITASLDYVLPAAEEVFTVPDGKMCVGWLAADGTLYLPGDTVPATEDASFTAQWADCYTVTFDANGGSETPARKVLCGTAVEAPTDPVKTGCALKGWRLGDEYYDFSAPVTADITLHAVWIEGAGFTITFEDGLPEGWTVENTSTVAKPYSWAEGVGGKDPLKGAHSGEYNLKTVHPTANAKTRLISPAMDLSGLSGTEKALLSFWYLTGITGTSYADNIYVYYRVDGGSWQELFSYTGTQYNWTQVTLEVPAAAFAENVQFSFLATSDKNSAALDDIVLSIVDSHSLSFSAAGSVITAVCGNERCAFEDKELNLTLTAPEKTVYNDGKNAAATLPELDRFNAELGLALSADDIAYYQGETLLETAPEIPGSYTAVFTALINDETYTVSVDYVISNATPAPPDALPGYTAVYGDMLSSVALPDGWNWNTPDVRVGNVGDNTFTATYSTGNAYYNTVSQDVTVTVERKTLTVTPDAGLSKVYGVADPEYYTYTVEGLVEGDVLEGGISRTAGENAGRYDYTLVTLSAGNNYNVVLAAGAPQFTITPKSLTVIADAKSKTYGEADPALTYTAEGIVGNDKITGALTRTGDDNVGVYEIRQGTLTAGGNYTISYTGASFTVGARVLTVTADAKSKTYGEADPELTYTVEGELVGSDTLTGALARTGNENAGTYAVTQGTLTAGDNYAISFTGADFTINKKALTVTADAKSKTYGEADPELTYTVEGELVGSDALTGALTRTGDDNVGVYEIRQGTLTAGDNYDLTFTGASFTIGKKDLTVTADAKTKVYGDPDPKLTYKADGLAAGDTVTVTLTRAPGKDAGVYAINAEIEAGENYNVVYVPADLTVTKRALTVKADAKSKEQGAEDPALTYKVTGLQYDDTATVTLTRAPGEEPGSYAITAVIDANDNYEVTYVGAAFTVRAPRDNSECPLCGEIHDEKTFVGFFTRFIHLLLYVIKRINFHMF